MSDPVSIEITTSIDLTHIMQRLEGEALEVFEDHGKIMEEAIRAKWVGWKYIGRDRASIGNSRAGWGHTLQATEGKREINFFNKARDYYTGEAYAAKVSRKKGATPEWIIMRDMLIVDYLPAMIKAVTAAVAKGMKAGPKKKVRENRSTGYTRISIT